MNNKRHDDCDCGKPVAMTINVTKGNGEVIESIHLCEKCALHKRSVEALNTLGIRIDASLIR